MSDRSLERSGIGFGMGSGRQGRRGVEKALMWSCCAVTFSLSKFSQIALVGFVDCCGGGEQNLGVCKSREEGEDKIESLVIMVEAS